MIQGTRSTRAGPAALAIGLYFAAVANEKAANLTERQRERRETIAPALIDMIYAAACETRLWQRFVDDLAGSLRGQCVGFSLRLPTRDTRPVWFGYGFRDELTAVFAQHLREGVPWEPARTTYWQEGFRSSIASTDRQAIEANPVYPNWFVPQGLSSEPPVGFTVAVERGRALAGVVILNPINTPVLESADFEFLDTLVPHLRRAFEIHTRLHEAHALGEALDRMPTGLALLNPQREVVLTNRTARTISEQGDGFQLEKEGPRLLRRADQVRFDRLFEQALHPDEDGKGGGVMAVTRKSGHRPFTLLIAPLLDAQQESTLKDAVAALYISDLEHHSAHRSDALRTLYQLTPAEAELVVLLCEGLSLDEAATSRGVTTNTARSQLKQVFVKTSTSRQSELVRLVLAGLPPAID